MDAAKRPLARLAVTWAVSLWGLAPSLAWKLYEQGKLPHDKLPALAKKFLTRKMRAPSKAE
jgi:hypothetical protein